MNHAPETLTFALKPFIVWVMVSAGLYWLQPIPPFPVLRANVEKAMVASSWVGESLTSMVQSPYRGYLYLSQGPRKIADLENRLSQAVVDQAEMDVLRRRDQELTVLSRLVLPSQFETVATARVFAGAGGKSINAGENAGLESNLIVLDANGVVVGVIGEVGRYVSQLTLLTRLEEPVTVRIAGKDIDGVLAGDGSVVRMMNVAQGLEMLPGDVVVTDGSDGQFPGGLAIGTILTIESKPSEVMQTAVVELLGIPDGIAVIGR
jgi:cell shape-determining protein MreC